MKSKLNILETLKKLLANKRASCKPLLEPKTSYPPKDPDGDAEACGIGFSTKEPTLKDIKERYKRMIEEFKNNPELNKMEKGIMGA